MTTRLEIPRYLFGIRNIDSQGASTVPARSASLHVQTSHEVLHAFSHSLLFLRSAAH